MFSCLLHFVVLFKGISLSVSQWLSGSGRHGTSRTCSVDRLFAKCTVYVTSGSLSFSLFLWFSIFCVVFRTEPSEYIGEVMYARQLRHVPLAFRCCSVVAVTLVGEWHAFMLVLPISCRRRRRRWVHFLEVARVNCMSSVCCARLSLERFETTVCIQWYYFTVN